MAIRKKGRGWEIVIDVGKNPLTGRRKQQSTMFYGSEAQAKEEEKRLKYEYKTKTRVDSSMPLEEYLPMWLSRTKSTRKYKTHESYESECRLHIIPYLGKKRLNKLKPLHIQEYFDYKVKNSELSRTTIAYHHRILRAALNQAIKWELLTHNPAYGAIPPHKEKFEPELITDLQAQQILELLEGDPRRISVLISLLTGMRRGETCALKWNRDISFDNKIIRVSRAKQRQKGKGIVDVPVKRGKARLVPMGNYLRDELIKHKEKQEENKQAFGSAYIDEDLVICWEDGRAMDPGTITKRFNWALQTLGISTKTRFHDLRHAHATWLLEGGANFKEVQDQLGHESMITTADIYLNPSLETRRQQTDKLDSRLKFKQSKKTEGGAEYLLEIFQKHTE